MKKLKLIIALLFIGLSLGFISCTDDNDDINGNGNNSTPTLSKGLYVLCEGSWGHNNASLDFYNIENKTVRLDLFNEINSQGLGETGNDIFEFNDKLFIAVKGSACIQVINKSTGKLIKRIPIVDNEGKNRLPSRFASSESMVFLCNYDGTVIEIEPNNLSLKRIVNVGRNPEDIVFSNGKLYVTNSGGLDYNTPIGYDKTVSIVDCSTMQELKKIEVGRNPGFIRQLSNNLVGLIIKDDNFTASAMKFVTINTSTDAIEKTLPLALSNFCVLDENTIIATSTDWNTYTTEIKKINLNSNTSVNFIQDNSVQSQITAPYGIYISKENNEVYITDAKDFATSGKVFVFDLEGVYKYSFDVNIIPSKVIFYNPNKSFFNQNKYLLS